MSAIRDRSVPEAPVRRAFALRAPSHRVLPVALVLGLALAAATLLTVAVRAPYTHANLGAGYDPVYARTPQALLGEETLPTRPDGRALEGDPRARGAVLYVNAGCASCHALGGRGGIVGPRIAGRDAVTIAERVRQGPVGMPRFSTDALGERQVADIAAYLRSLPAD